jgi:competence protein ComEA
MMKDKFNDLFNLPATQKRGYFLLGILLLLVVFAPAFYKVFLFQPEDIDLEKDRKEIEAFLATISCQTQMESRRPNAEKTDKPFNLDFSDYSSAASKLQPFHFNPNNLPADQWLALGFTPKQVRSIKNYEQKGGRFYSKQDVKKLWAISPQEFEIIEPFILLPDSLTAFKPSDKREQTEKVYHIVELNSADTTALKSLPGIGSAFASKIFNYKMKLGGYHSKFQLLEISGMDSARFAGIEAYIDINPWLIRPVNINTADFDKLSKHPYINNNVAISIINFRNRHGNYHSKEEVMKSELIDSELFKKLAPYLTTD